MSNEKAPAEVAGTSPADGSALLAAFVQGAAWWEYHQTGFTMWQSDRRLAEAEATLREQNGTLGVLPNKTFTGGEPAAGETYSERTGSQ